MGIIYGDATGHRHQDLLDVQFYAFDQPFLTDLGYPQSWASVKYWEGDWGTHNSAWGVISSPISQDAKSSATPHFSKQISGRGHLVRTFFVGGLQAVEVRAERWNWDQRAQHWYKPGITFKRLIALVETDGDGVALIDLIRISGGIEHWRVCRGLEGDFVIDGVQQTPRSGTVADPKGKRGEIDNLAYPDHAALACMDDVLMVDCQPASWKGCWQFSRQADVHLDVYQLRTNPTTETLTARSTAVMGNRETSNYAYRTLLWKNMQKDQDTYVDLVFEPRVGEGTLRNVKSIDNEASGSGVELITQRGKVVQFYWSPDADLTDRTHFSDGTELRGNLTISVDGKFSASGCSSLKYTRKKLHFP